MGVLIRLFLCVSLAHASVPAPSSSASVQSSQRRPDSRSWYQAYDDAKQAINKQDWNKALADLQVAAERGPRPGRNVPTYGDRVVKFIPDYYRGLALFSLRRFAEADAAFAAVGTSLIVKGDTEEAQFMRLKRLAGFENLMAQADQAMTRQQPAQAKQLIDQARTVADVQDVKRVDVMSTKVDDALRFLAENASRGSTTPAAGGVTGGAGTGSTTNPPAGTGNAGTVNPPPDTGVTNPAAPPTNLPTTNLPTVPVSNSASRGGLIPPAGSGSRGAPIPTGQSPPPSTNPASSYRPPSSYAEEMAIGDYYSGNYTKAAESLKGLADSGAITSRGFFYLACSRAAMVLVGAANQSGLADARVALSTAGNPAQFTNDLKFISPRVRQTLGIEK